jgi:hypothetical protein
MSAVYECPKCNSQDVYFGNKTIVGGIGGIYGNRSKDVRRPFCRTCDIEALPLKGESKPSLLPLAYLLIVFGLIWIMTYYVSGTGLPLPPLGAFNIAVGFAVMLVGFILTTRKR